MGRLKIQMWEGVTNLGDVAGAQVQRGESLKAFLGPSRHGGGEAGPLVGSGVKPFPVIMSLIMVIKCGMILDLVIK